MSKPPSILVIGDVHNQWRAADTTFLEQGKQDHALFVGDLGDEDVDIVSEISAIRCSKGVILGNHDAWRSFSEKRITKKLRASLDVLGDLHLAYDVREWPEAQCSIVGGRPFSWGGQSLRSPQVYGELYGVRSHQQSARKIVEAARRAQHRDIIIVAHNGPMGLSMETHDIWGKDFGKSPRGDWGDEDLELAIEEIRGLGLRVPLVIAGHMHHKLITPRGAERTRFLREGKTVYLNAAVVPRIRRSEKGGDESYFVKVSCKDGKLIGFEELWVGDDSTITARNTPRIMEEVG